VAAVRVVALPFAVFTMRQIASHRWVAPLVVLIVLLLVVPSLAHAQDKPKPRELTADVGYVSTSGNTDIGAFNVGEKLVMRGGCWEHKQAFGSVYAAQDGEQTSNLLFANWRSDWRFNPILALFGYVGFDRNEFAGISRRFEESVGLAAKLLTRERDQWTAELGLGVTQQKGTDSSNVTFTSPRSATDNKHRFSKTAYFQQGVEFLPNLETSSDYRINSESALVAPISAHIAMKVAYVARFDNLPEAGRAKEDRVLTSGLRFNW
jgi:putative salt-induced outer membrane protein